MKRYVAISGAALLGVSLAAWAALAWAQPNLGKLPPTEDPPTESTGVDGGSSPPISKTKAGSAGPTTSGSNSMPSPASLGKGLSPRQPGMTPATPAGETPPVPGTLPRALQGPAGGSATGPTPFGPMGQPGPANPPGKPATPAVLPATPMAPAAAAPQPLNPPLPACTEATNLPAGIGGNSIPPGDEASTESSMTPDNPTGRQEPAISLEWVGPPTAKVGQAGAYNLVVRNACSIPVQQVLVRVRIPNGINCAEIDPKGITEGNVHVWELGTLQPKQEKILHLKLLADQKGDVAPQAWVTFTGSSVLRIKVREPKLLLKAETPEKVLVGETVAFNVTAANPGDGSADQVKIHAVLSEGLEHPRGPHIDFDIGNLTAGEARNVTVMCMTKSGGVQKCAVEAEAEGGLHAKETAAVSVIMPRLDLQVMGPGLRYLGRKALYTIKVTNPSDAPANNVTIADIVPEGFKVLAASAGGRHDLSTRTVSWFIGEIAPGQSHEVKFEVQAINPGEYAHKASVVGARGVHAESDLTTRVEGLSALMLEMVDTEDPIEVSSETAYEVRITNTGSKVETNIKMEATIPDKMEFKSATGPVRFHEEGKKIVFEPIEKLAPKADAIFHINVKALDAGTVRFKVQMTSTNLVEPVIKMEATRIYADAPEVKTSH